MFGIGFTELMVIAVIAIVFVGPERLPQFMGQLGKFFVHTRRMASDVRSAVDGVIRDAEKEIRIKEIEDMKKSLKNVGVKLGAEANEILDIDGHRSHHTEDPADHGHQDHHNHSPVDSHSHSSPESSVSRPSLSSQAPDDETIHSEQQDVSNPSFETTEFAPVSNETATDPLETDAKKPDSKT